jgi:hypothetical protein
METFRTRDTIATCIVCGVRPVEPYGEHTIHDSCLCRECFRKVNAPRLSRAGSAIGLVIMAVLAAAVLVLVAAW